MVMVAIRFTASIRKVSCCCLGGVKDEDQANLSWFTMFGSTAGTEFLSAMMRTTEFSYLIWKENI
ncbi:hypothetical protein A9K72_31295 [Mesorhizobium loti]|nr:hypothetical protein A9174_31355 [Mesorhizobium loti NZP2037]OBP79540.1 hypothetical protein BAE41_29525 [Mesorhizobium loti]OBP93797.1 hypothetical protein BAE38_30140 [Mesorhizobium loti]OBQ73186.1 hypothetical protein A9K72_31295 [Mesorhizobium loti]